MVEARKRNITPEELIASAYAEHVNDFKDFQVGHTFYSSTNSKANKELCEYFFDKMKSKNHITVKSIQQLYCEHDKMFLPDRFVKGECPKCKAKDQYGDSCDVCASTYTTADLINPYCIICKTKPVQKPSDQLMFQLEHFRDYLQKWLPNHTGSETANKMQEWFNEPLRDWDISRNAPYFGFQIPGYTDKYFYVWVDAPMGYVSTTKEYCEKTGLKFDDFWKSDSKAEVYHLIGKDIAYFHTLFWPALLNAAEFRSPTSVWVHGFVNVNGEKMSKSKGTFLSARVYLNHLDPMYLRYYFASKFSSSVDDIDFNLEDFAQRTNAELIGKITNLASRGAQMLAGKMDATMSILDLEGAALVKKAQGKSEEIAALFESREFAKAMVEIRNLADETNRYFDEKAPWKTLATNPIETKQVLTSTLNMFRIIAIYLKPILPVYAEGVERLFNEKNYTWADAQKTLTHHKISSYQHLATRIDPAKLKDMMDANKKELDERAAREAALDAKNTVKGGAAPAALAGQVNESGIIGIDDFSKVDLRIAQIIEAEEIKEADKLLRLKVSLGPLGERQIIAGIKSAYKPEALKGRLVLVVANLAPRKMKFGMSEGMVLAAGSGNAGELFVLSPDAGAKPGDKVK